MNVSAMFMVKIMVMSIIAGFVLIEFVRIIDEYVGYSDTEEKLTFYDWSLDDIPQGNVYKWGKLK